MVCVDYMPYVLALNMFGAMDSFKAEQVGCEIIGFGRYISCHLTCFCLVWSGVRASGVAKGMTARQRGSAQLLHATSG